MLVRAGLIDQGQLATALESQRESGRRLGEELVELGYLTEVQMTQVLSNQLSLPWVSLYHVEFSRDLLGLLTPDVATRHRAVPVYVRKVRNEGDVLFVAMDDPTNEEAIAELKEVAGHSVRPMVAPPSEIGNAIRVYYFGSIAPAARTGRATERPTAPEGQRRPSGREKRESIRVAKEKKAAGRANKGSKRARPVTLTFLDGTTVNIPGETDATPSAADDALTTSDLVAALLARAQGADVSDVLPNPKWETLLATLLTVLMRKGLVADWEFVEELKKRQS
jgi:type IV pilus assembly protein PilB